MSLLRSALLLTLAVSLGCAHPVERRDWSDFDGPGAEYFHAERVLPPDFPDPVEPWNRGAGIFNHGLLVGIVSPLARGYRFVVPESVRGRIQKFAVNLVYPRRLVANLLQGNFSSFVVVGGGGLPHQPGRWLPSFHLSEGTSHHKAGDAAPKPLAAKR